VETVEGMKQTMPVGIDEELLRKREEFLAPLSQVLIVVISDEDDCSVQDSGEAWKIAEPSTSDADQMNLRCYDQENRLGADYLFPIDRYVDALQAPEVRGRAGTLIPNPLFMHGRTPDMVSVLLLTGVSASLLQDAAGIPLTTDQFDAEKVW